MTAQPSEDIPPWEFPTDMIELFDSKFHEADNSGASTEEAFSYALKAVLRILAWELDGIPVPPDGLGAKTLMAQHVLHRIGDQGNGSSKG